MGWRIVLAVVAVALAGCGGVLVETEVAAPTRTGTPTATAETAATAGGATTTGVDGGTTTARTEGGATTTRREGGATSRDSTGTAADNPWGTAELVVAINNTANRSRAVAPLVERTLAYWERGEGAVYANYTVGFVLRPDAPDPDVVVRFQRTVDCASEAHALGCAPLVNGSTAPDTPVVVAIASGYTDDSTVRTLEHEFGHLLGRRHGQRPRSVMAPSREATLLPRPDATDRPLPWQGSELAVAIDYGNVTGENRSTTRRQVEHALAYYAGGADGTAPANLSFRVVESPDRANVTVTFPRRLSCYDDADARGSCSSRVGRDTDGDGALEYYTRMTIEVRVDPAARGWHVGYWLGFGMGAADATELPPPFRDASYEERRGDWWT